MLIEKCYLYSQLYNWDRKREMRDVINDAMERDGYKNCCCIKCCTNNTC